MFMCVFLICLYHCVYEALSENWEYDSLFFLNLIQVTDSHQCHCHCHPGTSGVPWLHFPTISCHCSCSKGMEQVHRMGSSVHQVLSWCKQRSWTPSELLGWSIWKSLQQLVCLLSLEMGMDRQGAVGKEQHVAQKVSVAETPSLAIKERLFKALRVYLQLSKGSQGVCAEHLWQFQSRSSCCSWERGGSPAAENLLYKCHSCPALQESCTYPWQGLAVPHPASRASALRHSPWSLKEWRSPSFGSANRIWVFNHPLGLKVWQPWDWRLVLGTWGINLHHQIPTKAQLEGSAVPRTCLSTESFSYHGVASPVCLPWHLAASSASSSLRALPSPSTLFFHSCIFLNAVYRFFQEKTYTYEGFQETSTKFVVMKYQCWDLQRIWKLLRYPTPPSCST